MVVVLPAPFGPSTATTSPVLTSRSSPSTACCAPYALRSPRTSTAGPPRSMAAMLPQSPSAAQGARTRSEVAERAVEADVRGVRLEAQLPGHHRERLRGGVEVGRGHGRPTHALEHDRPVPPVRPHETVAR